MQILCDKVAGVHDMQAAGDPAVAALGTKPAPTLAKSVPSIIMIAIQWRAQSAASKIKPWLGVS